MKLLFDESLSPRLVLLLRDLFPESESALRNGLARAGDRSILDYAATHDFILVSAGLEVRPTNLSWPGAAGVRVGASPGVGVQFGDVQAG